MKRFEDDQIFEPVAESTPLGISAHLPLGSDFGGQPVAISESVYLLYEGIL